MRADIFIEWLHNLDYYFRTMDRKILLLIDNAGSQFNSKQFEQNSEKEESENDLDSEQESSQNRQKNDKKQKKKKKKILNLLILS